MSRISTTEFETPAGTLLLGSFDGKLCICDWKYRSMRTAVDQRVSRFLGAGFVEEETEVIAEARHQLTEYFSGQRREFDIPLLFAGTDFQQSVWRELLQISFGKTETYLGLSLRLNNAKAIRAVAAANGANALSIFVPCHRIIGSQGELIGYAGGLPAKKKLLDLEGAGKTQLSLFEEQ